MNKYDENYFNNLAANGVISGDEIRLFVGRILQYGYRAVSYTHLDVYKRQGLVEVQYLRLWMEYAYLHTLRWQ